MIGKFFGTLIGFFGFLRLVRLPVMRRGIRAIEVY